MILSHRIPFPRYADDRQFAETLAFLQRYRAVVDEICLFSENSNFACWPLAGIAENAAIIVHRLKQLRHAGFSALGINALNTLGHLDDVTDFYPPMPFPAMLGHDGTVSQTCPCPNAPALHAYLAEKYRLLAGANPDFIWVDDDFRMQSHAVAYPCFCTICLQRFGAAEQQREALVAALNRQENGALRQAWIAHNIRTLEELAQLIATAVHDVNPDIEIGLMTSGPGWTTYSGQAFDRLFAIFGGKRARPGGGFYTDYAPQDMLGKMFDTARQCATYPPQVNNIQYEVENFPCQALDKSPRTVLNEAMLALGAGCNGVAFSIFRYLPHALDDFHPLFQAMQTERPIMEALLQHAGALPLRGYWPVWSNTLMANRQCRGGDWFCDDQAYNISAPLPLANIGMPFTARQDAACGTVLSGRLAEALTDDQLLTILAGGVLLDGPALETLWERGYGDLTGVKPGRTFRNGVREVFTTHPLNGHYAGDGRSVFMAYFPSVAYEFIPLTPEVATLSMLARVDGQPIGPCVTGYQNALGGRIVALGYLPWAYNTTWGKRAQLMALADWAAGGRLPVRIETEIPVRVTTLVRMNEDGSHFAAILLNTSYDPSGMLTLHFRGTATSAGLLTRDGEQALRCQQQGQSLSVILPDLPPWQAMVILGRRQ